MTRTVSAVLPRLSFNTWSHRSRGIAKPKKSKATTLPVKVNTTSPENWLTDSSAQLTWMRPRAHAPAFQNLGQTCYMNSVLQVLLHLPLFDRVLASWPANRGLRKHCAHCELSNLRAACVRTPPGRRLLPSAFADNLRYLSPAFRLHRQQDAHEYLVALVQALLRASVDGCARSSPVRGRMLTPTEETSSPMHGVFGGMMQSVVECSVCGGTSARDEVFHDLSLEISSARSVDRALSNFTQVERLTGENKYKCDGCARMVNATKRFGIRRAPNVLALHLKRFAGNRKDNRFVQYPDKLDLAPYMFGAPDGTHAEYHLSGVVEHVGSSKQSGHYVAHVKAANGTWATKDDDTSSVLSARGALGKQAYILLYSRVPGPRSEAMVKMPKAMIRDLVDGSKSDVAMSAARSAKQKETMLKTSSGSKASPSVRPGQTETTPTPSPSNRSNLSNPPTGRNENHNHRVPHTSTAKPSTCLHLYRPGMHSDLDLELLSVTEGKQAAPVAANEDSESTAPVDSDCDGSSSSDEDMTDAPADNEPMSTGRNGAPLSTGHGGRPFMGPPPRVVLRRSTGEEAKSILQAPECDAKTKKPTGGTHGNPQSSSPSSRFWSGLSHSILVVGATGACKRAHRALAMFSPFKLRGSIKAGEIASMTTADTPAAPPPVAAQQAPARRRSAFERVRPVAEQGPRTPPPVYAVRGGQGLAPLKPSTGLFGAQGVGVWDGADDHGRDLGENARVAKRKRHLDTLDEEYDKGKSKKVRKNANMSRNLDGTPANPFERFDARKRAGGGATPRRY